MVKLINWVASTRCLKVNYHLGLATKFLNELSYQLKIQHCPYPHVYVACFYNVHTRIGHTNLHAEHRQFLGHSLDISRAWFVLNFTHTCTHSCWHFLNTCLTFLLQLFVHITYLRYLFTLSCNKNNTSVKRMPSKS